jgi:hypothetical protein
MVPLDVFYLTIENQIISGLTVGVVSRVQVKTRIKNLWLAEIEKDFWLNASLDLFDLLGY